MKPNLQLFLNKVVADNTKINNNLFICCNLFQVIGLIKFSFLQAENKKYSTEKLQKVLQVADRMLKDSSFPYKIIWSDGEPFFVDFYEKEKYEPLALFHKLKSEA